MPTASVTFDRPVYSPGDTIRMTVTVQAEDPAPVTQTIRGEALLSDGTRLSFSGEVVVDRAAPTLESVLVDDPTRRVWTRETSTPQSAVFIAVA